MKGLLGWCFRHPVIVVLLLFCLIAVIYRQAIFNLDSEQMLSSQAPVVVQSSGGAAEVVTPEVPVVSEAAMETGPDPVGSDEDHSVSQTNSTSEVPNSPVVAPSHSEAPSLIELEASEAAEGMHFRPESGQVEGEERSFHQYIQQARSAYWSGDEAGAIQMYQRLSREYPADPMPCGEMANIYLKQGKNDQAILLYQQTLDLLVQSGSREQAERLYRLVDRVIPGGQFREPVRGANQGGSVSSDQPHATVQ